MFIIKVDDKELRLSYDDFAHEKFLLQIEKKEFTVIYPSGYEANFKPKN